MTVSPSDAQLVKRFRQGNIRAFELLVVKYQSKILSLAGRYVLTQSDAQDVAQETFIKAYRFIGNFREDSTFYTWLYRIATNTAKDYLKHNKKRLHSALPEDNAACDHIEALKEYSNPENLLACSQLENTVFCAIKSLPADLRTALTLREIDGLNYQQIAEIEQCPIGTVRSRIFRAREMVDKAIKKQLNVTVKRQEV